MDLKTSCAMLDLYMCYAGLIQIYTLNYVLLPTKYQQEFIIVYPTPLLILDTNLLQRTIQLTVRK